MAKRDYYDVLGVSKSATNDEVKRAYRKIAVANHPDRNPSNKEAEDRFKEATEAYEILADEKRRKTYDQFGFAGLEGMEGANGFSGFEHAFRDFGDIFGGFSSVFESIFGGRSSSTQRSSGRQGSDLRYNATITLEEAILGRELEISYPRLAPCNSCNGTGARDSGGSTTCPSCGGRGQIRRSSGFFTLATTCEQCHGEGYVIKNPCISCRGTGRTHKTNKLIVHIPAGIDDGQSISLSGQGNMGAGGGRPGDLIVVVRIKSHQYYERHGRDIYCAASVSYTQATLGSTLSLPVIGGRRVKIRISSGTPNGHLLRLRGEGAPRLRSGQHRGDLYVRIQVVVPHSLRSKERALLEQLSAVEQHSGRAELFPLSDLEK